MRDLTSPRLIVLKGVLFVCAGALATAGVIGAVVAGEIGWRVVALHLVAVRCFCRAYYFAFYVIGKYVDPSYRFSGLWSAAVWMVRRGRDSGAR